MHFFTTGDVYIHVLTSGKSPLEDPPSISEGIGGKVTDYRINVSHYSFVVLGKSDKNVFRALFDKFVPRPEYCVNETLRLSEK